MLNMRSKGYKGSLSPTGRLTVGYDSANYNRERKLSQEYEVLHGLQTISVYGDGESVDVFLDDLPPSYANEVEEQKAELLIGFAKAKKYHKQSKPKGEDGIKPKQGDSIRASCLVLERKFTKNRLAMLTITIPPLGTSLNRYLCSVWGEFSRKFLQELKRGLIRGGATGSELDYCSISEIQEKRSRRLGEIYLHLHILYVAKNASMQYYTTPDNMREVLSRLLGNVRDEWQALNPPGGTSVPTPLPPIDTRAAIDMSMIRSSAIAYMGKYLSKGAKSLKEFKDAGLSCLFPRHWWSRAHHLARLCHALVIELPTHVCNLLMSSDTDYMDAISRWYAYTFWDGGIEQFKLSLCAYVSDTWRASMQLDVQWEKIAMEE